MKGLFKVWARRVALFIGLLAMLAIMMDFNARMVRLTQLRAQRDAEQSRLEYMVSAKAALQVQIAYAGSDSAVERWAREQGRLTKPNDIAVIPLPAGTLKTQPETIELRYIEPESNWDAWMQWLFYNPLTNQD